jgi:hypothetical protein
MSHYPLRQSVICAACRAKAGRSTISGIVKLISHAGVAYTLAACKQPDGYLRGNWPKPNKPVTRGNKGLWSVKT